MTLTGHVPPFQMKRRGRAARFGVVSMCIGSGMGAAAVFERGGEVGHFQFSGLLGEILPGSGRHRAQLGRDQFHALQLALEIRNGRLQHGRVAGIQQVVGKKRAAGENVDGESAHNHRQKNNRPKTF